MTPLLSGEADRLRDDADAGDGTSVDVDASAFPLLVLLPLPVADLAALDFVFFLKNGTLPVEAEVDAVSAILYAVCDVLCYTVLSQR
jgi:hypothetical protein